MEAVGGARKVTVSLPHPKKLENKKKSNRRNFFTPFSVDIDIDDDLSLITGDVQKTLICNFWVYVPKILNTLNEHLFHWAVGLTKR